MLLDAGFGFGENRDGERKDLVVGITSFGPQDCEDLGRPAVYTRISSYFDWIQQTLQDIENPEFTGRDDNEECGMRSHHEISENFDTEMRFKLHERF